MRKGWENMGALSGGMEVLNGIRDHEPTSVLNVEKTPGEIVQDVVQSCEDRRRPAGPVEVQRDVVQVEGELIPGVEKACSLLVAQAFK